MRLIDANALREVIETYRPVKCFTDKDTGKNRMVDYCLSEIDNAPTVEPETKVVINVTFNKEQMEELVEKAKADILAQIEIPQGEWKITEAYPHKVYCSVCYKTFADSKWEVWKDGSLPRAFCPNCGARMGGTT